MILKKRKKKSSKMKKNLFFSNIKKKKKETMNKMITFFEALKELDSNNPFHASLETMHANFLNQPSLSIC